MYDRGRPRPIVVSLDPSRPSLIGLRLKGTRRVYWIAVDGAYKLAVRNAIAAERAERAKAREEKRKKR
jgi:hypothetical protein